MFFLNWVILMFGFMNLCNVESVVWFLVDTKPLLDTSKQLTLHLYSVISVVKCEYLLLFSKFLVSICFSKGQVSSNRWMVLLCLFRMTMSGF